MMDRLDAIVFDCDGVLLNSNELKVQCFRDALDRAGFAAPDVARFSEFQRNNFGMSRYRLFEALLGWDGLAPHPPTTRDELVAGYADILGERYVRCDATPGAAEVLPALGARLPLYVVSGSDQAELRLVLGARADMPKFRLILGSPATKDANLSTALADITAQGGSGDAARVLFVGDAEADWRAAAKVGTAFVYMDSFSTVQPRMRALAAEQGFPLIPDLRALPGLLGAG